jgi:RHS repeat-associated protein
VDRLIYSVKTPTGGPVEDIRYVLDGAGNREQVIGGPGTGAYSLSATSPEPADRQVNQYTSTPLGARLHDLNGNVVGDNVFLPNEHVLVYNYRNCEVGARIQDINMTASYAYDALGRRIGKQVTGPNTEMARFTHIGWRAIEEQDTSNATVVTYTHGNYIDEILEARRGDQVFSYHVDDLFNLTAISSSDSTILERNTYSDFGLPSQVGGGKIGSISGNRHYFSGREFDQETGLNFFLTRYQSPPSGRYMSRDRIGPWGDQINLGNAFGFLGNNPMNSFDPFGLLTQSQCTVIRDILAYEREHGTADTTTVFSNTGGSQSMGAEFDNQPVETAYGIMDLDWWTDLRGGGLQVNGFSLYGAGPKTVDLYYWTAKNVWNWVRGSGAEPGADTKEVVAVNAIKNGALSYSDLFPPSFLSEKCGDPKPEAPQPETPGDEEPTDLPESCTLM